MHSQAPVPILLESRRSIFQKYFAQLEHPLHSAVERLLLVSDYACRQIETLATLLAEDDCLKTLDTKTYHALVTQLPIQTTVLFSKELRLFRHRHFLRLLLRELAGLASTEETMRCWSDCADALILKTLQFCEQELSMRHGKPIDEAEGRPTKLYVLAMGKLGGRELNYSSDIDLIFAFSAAGYTQGEEQISNQQFYSKVVQHFIQLLQTISAEGFVFRVDLRLRPNGDSGALVSTLTAVETYYQEQGRDWERYAMVKARLIGEPAAWFEHLIIPFVYRRYVDFSVIEALRSMKAMIEREIRINPMLDDIKRGFGGIREVEFIIQNFQLIRGGRLPQLRQQNAMKVLDVLKKEGLLERTGALKQAYLFLRKLENFLQAENDQQTHALPKEGLKQAQLVLAMGYRNWQELEVKLQQYQRIISTIFSAVLYRVDGYEDENRLLANQLSSVWQGHVENTMAVNLLASLGFQEATRCYQIIHAFRHAPRCRRLTQTARIRLDRFMPLLLSKLSNIPETDKVLLKVLHLLENIVGRSAYLALLTENLPVLDELLHWFTHSPFISSLLVSQPFLLELLLDQEEKWHLFSRRQLKQNLVNQLANYQEEEAKAEALRQFKLTNWLIAARAEMDGQYDALRIGRFLADVADVIIEQVVELACQQLAPRYPDIIHIKAGFSLIAYGKLGSKEMNYNSDLDLVFIHSATADEVDLVTRLSQKILHMLTTRSVAGVLYTVDTRLRPSGAAGLLVSHIDAFIDYQCNQAWIWEHQALLRARVLSKNRRIRAAFKQLKIDVLFQTQDELLIRDEVLAMRAKINRYSDAEQIKYAPGGLVDLEFLIQFLVLTHPNLNLVKHSNMGCFLRELFQKGVLNKEQFKQLSHAYKYYHALLHQQLLQSSEDDYSLEKAQVLTISQEFYKNKP